MHRPDIKKAKLHFKWMSKVWPCHSRQNSGLHFKYAPCPSSAHIGKVEFAGGWRDDFERPGGAGTGEVSVHVRAGWQVIGREYYFFIAQLGVREVPPAPAALCVISQCVGNRNGCIGQDG